MAYRVDFSAAWVKSDRLPEQSIFNLKPLLTIPLPPLRLMTSLTDTSAIAPFADVRTLPELFAWRVKQSPRAAAYLVFDATTANWLPISWESIGSRVERMAQAMETLNLARGARIAILLPNGLEAVSIDLSALAIACVPVPLHALDNPASIAYILADSDASVLVAQTEAQWLAIAASGVALPSLHHVFIAEGAAAAPRAARWP